MEQQGYSYYANGLKNSFTAPDGTTYTYTYTFTYTYDPGNRLSSIDIPGVGRITYNTYQWTRLTLITLPGGGMKEMSYDPLMRIKVLTAKDPGGNTVLNYRYGYDKRDNIVNKCQDGSKRVIRCAQGNYENPRGEDRKERC